MSPLLSSMDASSLPTTPEASENGTSGSHSPSALKDAVVDASKKKRRRKRNKNVARSLTETLASEVDRQIHRDERDVASEDAALWQSKAEQRLGQLNDAVQELRRLEAEVSVSAARVEDAEAAEAAVNAGLKSAHSLIAERDRALAEMKTENANFRAEVAQLNEDKKKNEKRLVLLKTMSANLHEARENCDAMKRRGDELSATNDKLNQTISAQEATITELKAVELQLANRKNEVEHLHEKMHEQREEHRRERRGAVGLGATAAFATCFALRVLSGVAKGDKHSE